MEKQTSETLRAVVVWAMMLLVAVTSRASGATYTFTKIVDDTGPYALFSRFDVNGAGTVVFTATPHGGGAATLYFGNGGDIKPVAKRGGTIRSLATANINDNGDVAFQARLQAGGDSILICQANGQMAPIADLGTQQLTQIQLSAFSSTGTVVFLAKPKGGAQGIFACKDGVITKIADATGRFSRFERPQINAAGTVVFEATLAAGGGGVYTSSGGDIKTISESSVTADRPAINAAGHVVFRGSSAIHAFDGSAVTTVADTKRGYTSFQDFEGGHNNSFQTPGISDDGTVVFAAQLADGSTGLFAGPDPVKDRIIGAGDPLFGSTLKSIQFFGAVSRNGNLVFGYDLANEVSGVALASPMRGPATQPAIASIGAEPPRATTRPSGISPQTARYVDWYRRSLVDVFKASPRKRNEVGDHFSIEVLDLESQTWSQSPAANGDEDEKIWEDSSYIAKYGCDDPMVLYSIARNTAFFYPNDLKRLNDLHQHAADAMQASSYSPLFKIRSLLRAVEYSYDFARKPLSATEADHEKKMVDAAMALVPAVGADSDIPPEAIIQTLKDFGDLSEKIENDRSLYVNRAFRALAPSMKNQSLLLTLAAQFLIDYAWNPAGDDSSAPESIDLFRSRMEQAGKLLEQAWALDDHNSAAAAERIRVAQGLGEPRGVMEQWYGRAIAVDPDNLSAYQNKLSYLVTEGPLSEVKAIQFGRECLRSERWNTSIPLILFDAYSMLPPGELTDEKLATPEAWADLKAMFEGYIAAHQRSKSWRSQFLALAARGGHWADANEQLKRLGSEFSLKYFTQAEFDAVKKKVGEKMVGAAGDADGSVKP